MAPTTSERRLRVVTGVLSVLAIAALAWLGSLPDKEECVASGRVVDPTERHCQAPDGYQQLQEHALFHAAEVLLWTAVLLAGGLGVRYYLRRRSSRAAPSG